jgi:hypothetical protein
MNRNEIINYIKNNPKYLEGNYLELSKIFNVSYETIRHIVRKLRRNNSNYSSLENTYELEEKDTKIIDSKNYTIKTPEELINYLNIDLAIWELEKSIVNKWEIGSKVQNQILSKELYQVKIWLKKKKQDIKILKEELIEGLRSLAPYSKLESTKKELKQKSKLLCISLPDLHFGKTVVDNSELSVTQKVVKAIAKLIQLSSHNNIDRIVFPVGNDLLNVDNMMYTTTRGTHQFQNENIKSAYINARVTMCGVINYLKTIAKVDLIIVTGNHDSLTAFTLGDALESYYYNDKNVTINNTISTRKYYTYGENLIGFTHGDKEKHSDLPLIMAQEVPKKWAESKTREWHLGHFHREKTIKYVSIDSAIGVKIRILPSLSGTDDWHYEKGYISNPEAQALIYDKEEGFEALYNFKI